MRNSIFSKFLGLFTVSAAIQETFSSPYTGGHGNTPDYGSINFGEICYARKHNRRNKIVRRYRQA
jgi:hypothetical protein